jgi:hypothetical protein
MGELSVVNLYAVGKAMAEYCESKSIQRNAVFVHKLRQLALPTTRPQERSSRRLHQPAGYHGSTIVKALCLDNDAARAELTEIATRLDAASAAYSVGLTWTVATSLCHLAFWDRRVLFQLERWQESGSIEAVRLDPQSVASINEAVNMIALRIPAPAAIALAVESAAAVDTFIGTIDEEWLKGSSQPDSTVISGARFIVGNIFEGYLEL